jgi:dCMP deaminase
MFFEIAQVVAKRSTCFRLNVGCVIVCDNNIVSIGYNGPPPGEPHCSGKNCPSAGVCARACHAERNALERLATPFKIKPKDVFITDSPCVECWLELIEPYKNIKNVYFGSLYRINDHLLDPDYEGGLYRITPSGYIVDYRTGELCDE